MSEIVPTRVFTPSADAEARPAGAVAPRVRVGSVGDVPGLSPRRKRKDGGEVPGADVDTVDALDRAIEWPTVVAWLTDQRAVTTRRGYLADVASFLRWMDGFSPQTRLLAVDRDLLSTYRDALGIGMVTGKPAAARTVARRIAGLSSLFGYAAGRDIISHNPASPDRVARPYVGREGTTPAMGQPEASALLDGAEQIASERPEDAAAVLLLGLCALRVGELVGATVGNVREDAGHLVIMFRGKGGKESRLPIPHRARAVVERLCQDRPSSALLLCEPDGSPWDRWRARTAIRRAGKAAGIPRARLQQLLSPHMSRATVATLLLDNGVPLRDAQDALRHASPETTRRYDRGEKKLDAHPLYRLAGIHGGGS